MRYTLLTRINQIDEYKKMTKTQIKGLTLEELDEYFIVKGEKKFRGKQVFKWMYNDLVTDFNDMLNLPVALRSKLSSEADVNTLEIVDSETSPVTGTKKFIFQTSEENKIESVLIPEESTFVDGVQKNKRTTLCISTQVGCPLDCQFCATGLMGYKKNLTPGEIFDQYALAARVYGKENLTNIVYMGMGEPLLNFKATVNSLKIFTDKLTTGINRKRITVSTAGIAPKIKELADTGLNVKLAFSLHSCFEDKRKKIMPINKRYSLKENIKAIKYYSEKTKTRITFEYIMLKDINDRTEDINGLTKLCSEVDSKINIIPFNSLKHMNPGGFAAELEPTSRNKIDIFAKKLREKNISVFVRNTQGDDIAAACGQLAVKFK